SKINALLKMFPAVAILGPRQCGKTTLAQQLRPDWMYVDLEKPSDFNRIISDPEFFLQQNEQNVIIDEAQKAPQLFNVLRGVIDQNRTQKGRFILTGSSSPALLKSISESLAGRIATIELGTLKCNELHAKPLSRFYKLFEKKLDKVFFKSLGSAKLNTKQLQKSWFKGGYPEPVLSKQKNFYAQWMQNYEQNYIYRDVAALFPKLNKVTYQRFLTMLCKLSGTILNKKQLAHALETSDSSVQEFLRIATGTFIWRQQHVYSKSVSKSILKMPKGHVRDSGLLHSLLRIHDISDLYNDPIIGSSFESFVIEEISKGLNATMTTNWDTFYYRTRSNAEVDLIIEGPFGVLPIEIKYGLNTSADKLKHLEKFIKDNQLEFGLLINQAKDAHWLSRHVFQLPATYL
ncbi:MAG: ATP-binding protein, partial [Candidatus Thioglobus sp.]